MQDLRFMREERKRELEHELGRLKLFIRYDSRLCCCYINGVTSPEWTAQKVARECAIMHWLYNYTDYEERCREAATAESKKTWFHSGKHFADHMKRRVYPAIKESILKERKQGDLGSETWPWIINEPNRDDTCQKSIDCESDREPEQKPI